MKKKTNTHKAHAHFNSVKHHLLLTSVCTKSVNIERYVLLIFVVVVD